MPSAPLRICATPGCHERQPGRRCALHERTSPRNHRGIPRQARGHGRAYEVRRSTLIGRPCHWCGQTSTTADYEPPFSAGGSLADLVPSCGRCNYARGAALARAAQ